VSNALLKNILGWCLSLLLHLGVVVAAYIGLPYLTRPEITPPPPIAIEFIAISTKTQQVAPKVVVEEEAAEEKPQPKYAAAEQPTASPLDDAVPLPAKAEIVKPAPKVKPKPQISKARKLAQRIRPNVKPKPPSRFKSTRIAALIDRSIKEEKDDVKKDDEKKVKKKKNDEKKKKPSVFAGLQGRMATATVVQAFSQKVSSCWNLPGGAKGVYKMTALVRIRFRPDGTIMGRPEFLSGGDMDDGFYRVFVDTAIRAVLTCGPYELEAKALFEMGNNYIDFNFDPSGMGLE